MTAAGEWTPEGQAARERQGAFERARDSNERWRTGHPYVDTPTVGDDTIRGYVDGVLVHSTDPADGAPQLNPMGADGIAHARGITYADPEIATVDPWPTAGQCSDAYAELQRLGGTLPPDVGPLTGMARVLRAAHPHLTNPTAPRETS